MRHHHRSWVLSWLHHLSTQVPHRGGAVYGAMQVNDDTTPIDPTWMERTGGFAKDMTLRQWYAGLAMQGFIANGAIALYEEIADEAVVLADAMLKAEAE